MGLFNFLKKTNSKNKEATAIVDAIERPTEESIKITFANNTIPEDFLDFKAGQYTNVKLKVNDSNEIRSYSLCSKPKEKFEIAIKAIPNGLISNHLNENINVGDEITITKPEGNFKINQEDEKMVCFAAGSGITPILSIAKEIEGSNKRMHLHYGNKSLETTMFHKELNDLKNTQTLFYFSRKSADNSTQRLDSEFIKKLIKSNLEILKSDKFLLCGPEQMIIDAKETLKSFGINDEKIIYELFTSPVKMKPKSSEETIDFDGESEIEITLDGIKHAFTVKDNKQFILDIAEKKGVDIPFSCRGGLCCSCRSKVTEGSMKMKVNYALTDEEVKEGYVLACQAMVNSSKIKLNFDE
ncbi:MAG: iron-sulfur cluster-binding domain-containing protein [Crocinitomicaceae bacterium]|nr:iron-sulfur cluster-binding domain-containing protein [Crocinitomicaceae bacterium]